MTDEEAIRVGARAGVELAMCETAFEGLKAALVQELVETPWDQSAKRERLYVALKTLSMVKVALEDAVQAAETARGIINYRNQLASSGLTQP